MTSYTIREKRILYAEKVILTMLFFLLSFSTRDPAWVLDDADNAVIDTTRLSSSLALVSSTKTQGSRKLLKIKKTQDGAELPFYLVLQDKTFSENYYYTLKGYNSSFVDYRNISAKAFLIDGNFSTDQAVSFMFTGIFMPSTQLGVLKGIFPRPFKRPEKITEETRNEWIQTLKTQEEGYFLSFAEYYFDYDVYDRAEKGEVTRKQCSITIHYKLGHSWETDADVFRRLPDNEQRYAFRKAGKPVPNDETKEYVPNITYYMYSNDCAFSASSAGRISNPAPSEWHGNIFFAVMLVLEIAFSVCAVIYVIRYQSPARIEALSLTSMVFHLNAEYLCSVLFIICTSEIPGLRNAASLLAVFGFVVLTPILLHTIEKVQIYARRYLDNVCKYLSFILLITFSFILPGLMVIFIAIIVPYLATFIMCLVMASYLLVVIIQKFVEADPRPCFPLYFTLPNMIVKIALLTYCFGIDNAFGFEFHKEWIWVLLGVFLSQNVLYVIQYFAGPRFGFQTRDKTFRYDLEMLHEETLKQIDIVSTEYNDAFLVAFAPGPNVSYFCANPGHTHSARYGNATKCRYLEMLSEAIPKLDLAACNCFCGVRMSYMIACPICLTDIPLLRVRNGSRIFSIAGSRHHKIEQAILQTLGGETEPFDLLVTPCGHCFHNQCLGAWLAENQNCPVDRSYLPAMGK